MGARIAENVSFYLLTAFTLTYIRRTAAPMRRSRSTPC